MLFRSIEKHKTENDFIYFKDEIEIFLKQFVDAKKGISKIYSTLLECKAKEDIVKKNIFLHYENILDWKVDESLIKVESQKFNELTETISDFIEIKINNKYEFKKLLEKTFKLHENICKEITEWLENNEIFFDYKDNLGI